MTGKYTPARTLLARPTGCTTRSHVLVSSSIERVSNDKLPASAYEHQAWWANEKEGNHVNARAWANAGWKVDGVDFNRKQARLVRIG